MTRLVVDARISRGSWHTGVGVLTRQLVESVRRQRADIHVVLLVNARGAEPPFGPAPRLEVVEVPLGVGSPRQHRGMRTLLREFGADVVFHTHPLAACVQTHCPGVAAVLDLDPLLVPWEGNAGVKMYERWILPVVLRRMAGIVALSAAARDDIARLMELPRGRIAVLPLGVARHFRPQPVGDAMAGTLARYGITPPYVLYHGNKRAHKNVPRLVDAFGRLCRERDWPHQLVIAGRDDPGEREFDGRPIRAVVTALGLAARVRYTGFIDEHELPAVFSGADVTVVPSLYEGFGLTALEAMACGCPVVVSNRGGLAEVVGHAGIQVDPLDTDAIAGAMRRVVRDRSLAVALRAAGLRRAAEFTWEATARSFLGIVEGVARCGESRQRSAAAARV